MLLGCNDITGTIPYLQREPGMVAYGEHSNSRNECCQAKLRVAFKLRRDRNLKQSEFYKKNDSIGKDKKRNFLKGHVQKEPRP